MSRSLRHLVAMPLLGTLLAACGNGSVPVTSGGDPPGGSSSSGSSSGSSSSSSSSSGSSSGGNSGVATTDVLTYHYNAMRTGENRTETLLTPANVNSATFGLLHKLGADGLVDAAPLVVTNLSIGGVSHNLVYVASEHDSLYAYDADGGALLKQVSLLGSGEISSDARNCDQVVPEIGITSTPVIDRSAGPNGTIFLVAMSRNTSTGTYYQRLHALDLVTLAERPSSPVLIQASSTGTAGAFVPGQYKARGALLLEQGQIYTVWASNCDIGAYNGWIMAYDETSLSQTQVLNLTPNGSQGGIWDVAGVAVDSTGALYTLLGNGTFDTTLTSGFPNRQDYGNAAVKLSLAGGTLALTDYFTPWNTVSESQADIDFGSGSPVLLPDQIDSTGATRHLMLAAGKDSNIYLLDRDNMGKYNGNNNSIYQELAGVLPQGVYSVPVYFNGSIYIGDVGGTLKQYALGAARLPSTPTSHSSVSFAFPGASPSISGNVGGNAIVWAVQSGTSSAAVLHAYNPTNLAIEYYNSTQATGGRDAFGNGNKYITPVVANGKVFVAYATPGGTLPSGVAVFGLL